MSTIVNIMQKSGDKKIDGNIVPFTFAVFLC